ncbi:PKD domain-containing protein [Salinibacter ruber]|uniref:PKD domain-containing protein n=1 Tax=Salinibacter ruber TaxID=146919 RepID=UPI00216A2C4B|nr:PKD domain-containing protein [Salinibacter ruber]
MRLINLDSKQPKTSASLLTVFLLAAVVALPTQAQSTDRVGDKEAPTQSSSASSSSADASSEGLRVASLDGPTRAYAGEPVTYTASVKREGLSSSVPYRWQFGEDRPGGVTTEPVAEMISKHLARHSELVATYTYDRPGTYTVRVSVGQGKQEASASAIVTITDSSSSDSPEAETPAMVASTQNSQEAQRSRSAAMANRPGQWGIVVASMRSAEKADVVARRYRGQFGADRMPVEIMEADLESGRYFRVIVGQFKSEKAAWKTISAREEELPIRAWTVRYQKRFLSEAGP